ncbi:DNA ligase [Azoarcus olearius]|uniref:DNA ligase n=1 Tax=Azoarcus sp. (strain BH72) TaxID=418699 RepID=UPI00080627CE|nr:DNA ligase [Azoarcus olearius]ANQ86289.1 DNA ligase [Azoarcus olearius]
MNSRPPFALSLLAAACVALALLSVLPANAIEPAAAERAPAVVPPALMLAGRYRDDIDPAAYLVSEKLDGVRAYWDGTELRFRSGQRIEAPGWFVAALPRRPLDGELWLGRGRFEALSGLVRRQQPDDAGWRAVRYMVFELPAAAGPFAAREAELRRIVAAAGVPWLQAVAQSRVRDRAELQARLAATVKAGGEGLMLHRADAAWRPGRVDTLLKLTPWLDDEARVVGYVAGKGRLAGVVGALEVEAADGRRFRLGSGLDDAQRRAPPPVGSLVTYRYRELTGKGLPRFPRFLRVRELP